MPTGNAPSTSAIPPLPELFLQSGKLILFAANIDPEIDVDCELVPLMQSYGVFCRLTSAIAPSGMRFMAVTYDSLEPLRNAMSQLNGVWLGSSRVFVTTSYPPVEEAPMYFKELYVTNFSEWIDEEVLFALFRPYGTINQLVLDRSVHGYRYAVVTFAFPFNREVARFMLHRHCLGDGFSLWVKHPPPAGMRDHGQTAPDEFQLLQERRFKGFYVRVSGINPMVDELKLRCLFAQYGTLLEFCPLRSYDQRPLGFAILRYFSIDAARQAAQALNHVVLGGSILSVKVVSTDVLPFDCAFDVHDRSKVN